MKNSEYEKNIEIDLSFIPLCIGLIITGMILISIFITSTNEKIEEEKTKQLELQLQIEQNKNE